MRETKRGEYVLLSKDQIADKIRDIRISIGHDDIKPDIKELIYENDEITIIAPDRPEKSMIIGKGGWVVGRLKEELGVKSIHVISYTDIIIKQYQLELSLKHLRKTMSNKGIPEEYMEEFNNLYALLEKRYEKPYDKTIISDYIRENIHRESNPISNTDKKEVVVSLSGGVDSSFSTILTKALGFNTLAITVDPGTIILPNHFKRNIRDMTSCIDVNHHYIETDMSPIISDALSGTIHPCGRCSAYIEEVITSYMHENNLDIVVFGDVSATGSQSIVFNEDIIRINLPAMLKMEKSEIREIASEYDVKKIKGYGCPLIVQVHKKYPQYRTFSIQRVLRETRAGVLEPGEALELIRTI